MKDKDVIRIETSLISVTGMKSVEKRTNGDIVESRNGSFTHKHIASFFLVVEDNLAKEVIDVIAYGLNLPRKYIYAGVWGNQAACLFGFLIYAEQLKSTNVPQFSILAIDDGDMKPEQKKKRLENLLKGGSYGGELVAAEESLSKLMLSFNLEYIGCNVKEIKGLPEYNHKKWFEEIEKETILSVNKPSNLYEEQQVESLLDLIEFSKSIILDDYHCYYVELKKCRLKNTLDMFHMTEYFVLNAIKKYNNDKWQFYTGHIKEALIAINEENRKNFIEANTFFNM